MHRALRTWVRGLVIVVALAALAVLCGYVLRRAPLTTIFPQLQAMSLLTAGALLCLCGSIFLETFHRIRSMAVLASGAILIAALVLTSHLIVGKDWLSLSLEQGLFDLGPLQGGQTSVATAGCLAALGIARLLRGRPWMSDGLSGLALITAGIALLGYVYGVNDLYAVFLFRTMALHTAIGLFALSLASLLVRPDGGLSAIVLSSGVGGQATRRQLAFLLVPAGIGYLVLQGIAARQLGIAAAMALVVVSAMVPLGLLILRDGHALNELERERQQRALAQAAAAEELSARLAAQAEQLRREGVDRTVAEQNLARTQRMEAVGQLTGGIAHDFNNLLMAIGGNLQLILKRLASEHPARRFAGNAQAAIERGSKLTAQLLTFSRTQKLVIRPIDLDAVLTRSRDRLVPTLGPHISVRTSLDAPGAWALGDPDQLELALLNLALNARDAMPEGGELCIESGKIRAGLTSQSPEREFLFIRIRDTGTGMTPAVASRAIEPFFTTKQRGQGSGLGLAQAYGFVRQCGGDLTLDSEPGNGTTVQLLLPSTPSPGPPPAAAEPSLAVTGGSAPGHRPLLVIDDDEAVRVVLVEALRDSGYTVIEAPDGVTGLEMITQQAPAAAIIDFLMPGLNGADVARQARQRHPHLPIIFVSGYYDTQALDEISGAVVLRKPVDVAQLQRTIASVVAEA